jgi:hypothetical protein
LIEAGQAEPRRPWEEDGTTTIIVSKIRALFGGVPGGWITPYER